MEYQKYPYVALLPDQVSHLLGLQVDYVILALAPGRYACEVSILYKCKDMEKDHKLYIDSIDENGGVETINDHDGPLWTSTLAAYFL